SSCAAQLIENSEIANQINSLYGFRRDVCNGMGLRMAKNGWQRSQKLGILCRGRSPSMARNPLNSKMATGVSQ
ncbi:MAG: hypothetical protein MUE46_18890, partial [Xanthomonadales bacterium]|nr:hypothetical protein [Xanthomonadales bacterium]